MRTCCYSSSGPRNEENKICSVRRVSLFFFELRPSSFVSIERPPVFSFVPSLPPNLPLLPTSSPSSPPLSPLLSSPPSPPIIFTSSNPNGPRGPPPSNLRVPSSAFCLPTVNNNPSSASSSRPLLWVQFQHQHQHSDDRVESGSSENVAAGEEADE